MNAKLIHLPPWPTGWRDITLSAKQGGLSFAGIFHGDVVFMLDDVFLGAGILWQVNRFAFDEDTYSWDVGATSVASLQDLVELIPHS